MPTLFLITYIIGIPISYAILEEFDDAANPHEGFIILLMCAIWPFILFMLFLTIGLYPIYWLTKKLITIFKSYQNDKKRRIK